MIRLTNLYNFRDLSDCKLEISYFDDGVEVESRECSLKGLAPRAVLDVFYIAPAVEGEGVLKVRVLEPESPYCEDGHILAEESFVLGKYNYNAHFLYAQGKPSAYDDGSSIHITGVDFNAGVDKKTGGIVSMTRLGKELLRSPVLPNFCRATIDNDAVPQVPALVGELLGANRFKKATAVLTPKNVTLGETGNEVTVEIDWKMPHMKYVKTKYSFYLNGGVRLDLHAESRMFNMERYGFTFELEPEMTAMEFYGKGPHENYCDRAYSAELGIYSGKPEEFMHDYLYPQENGCRTGVRWLTLSGGKLSLKVLAVGKEVQTTVHAYTHKQLDEAKHACELKKGKHLTVYVDGGQRGVGGDTPAMACLNEKYKLKAGVPFSTSCILFFENKEEYSYEESADATVTSEETTVEAAE